MTYYGQSKPPEDQIADAVFGDFIGTCVEVGAYNGIDLSNTYHFYLKGWRCINFEPHADSFAKLCEHQPKATNLWFAIGARPIEVSIMYTSPDKPIVTGFDLPEWYVQSEAPGGLVPMSVFVTNLDNALWTLKIKPIDYISIDVDGTEMDVLKGFDLAYYQPRLMIIEYNHALTKMTSYLAEYGYQLAHTNSVNGFWTRTQADYDAVQRAVK